MNELCSSDSHYSTAYSSVSETYLGLSRISKMDLFAKPVDGFQPLNIFAKCSILDVRLWSEHASVFHYYNNYTWLTKIYKEAGPFGTIFQ